MNPIRNHGTSRTARHGDNGAGAAGAAAAAEMPPPAPPPLPGSIAERCLRAVSAARPRQIGMIMSVRTSFTTTAWLAAPAPKVVAVATTDDVSLTAVPAKRPNDCWLIPIA